ncbi:unnamed protein product [Adineta steineri]|uniref:FAD-binding domain-containing protein n=1 Tax=Adineta steineri TaxID=433720 RepID=A0A819IYF0_9BILA|nr:unnamed protein product [Adineta steineri]CAF3924643.1 unnamed protein product [Adineta steineri]
MSQQTTIHQIGNNIQIINEILVKQILLCDDNQRLDYLLQIFSKYEIIRKRYETKAWHSYFRRIAMNPVIFYENNSTLFDQDNQYEQINQFNKNNDFIIIHGNLHIGQFQYYIDDKTNQQIFYIRNSQNIFCSFTKDLKRLGANIALIAYCHGCDSYEINEIINNFIRKYIKIILKLNKSKQSSINNQSVEVSHQIYEINWQSINTMKDLLILSTQLAIATANLHYQPTISIINSKNIQTISTILSSSNQQQKLIDEICLFSMIYAEIAERDHRLFFRNFRNERIFQNRNILKQNQIQYPLIPTHSVSILIVGGGICGMATALNFARAGIQVRLIEKNNEFIEVGAGMQLAPNASRLLDQLGILENVQAKAVFPKQIVWMDALSGEHLTSIDLGEKFIETFQYPYIVVHRADLLQILYQACLQTSLVIMETNRTVINVDERPKSLMIQCADGIRYDCKMVIAADGLWSTLRKFVCHDDGPPISVGYVTYRGTVDINQVSKEAGLNTVQFWIGPDIHLVQYPIRHGQLFNQAAVFRSNQLPDETDQWGTKEELNQRFSICCSHVKDSLKLIQTNFRWPVYDRNPIKKWNRDRLILLGDAAHPMLQYAGQGAAQALEDAFTLVDIFKKYNLTKFHTIFHEYEQKRIPRSSKVVQFARDIGIFAHYNGIAKILRDSILRMHDINDFSFLEWLYGENNE